MELVYLAGVSRSFWLCILNNLLTCYEKCVIRFVKQFSVMAILELTLLFPFFHGLGLLTLISFLPLLRLAAFQL